MKELLNAFYFTLSYFTSIPIFVKDIKISKYTYKYTLFFLPFIGMILSSIVILISLFFSNFFNPLYASFISSILYLYLYGFLHLEAVCDVIDAFFASHGGKDAYEIMKEPTIGAIGALYTFCFVLLKIGIITYILYEKHYFLFVFICTLSRLNLIYLLEYFTFNKDSFLSKAFVENKVLKLKIYALIYVFIGFLIIDTLVFLLFFISLFLFYNILKYINKKFGFINGDCLGFTIEHTELLLLNIGLVFVL